MRRLWDVDRHESEPPDVRTHGRKGIPPHFRQVLTLQSRAGNGAVARMLGATSADPTLQRCGGHDCQGGCDSDVNDDAGRPPDMQRLMASEAKERMDDGAGPVVVRTEALRSPDSGFRVGDGLGKALDNAEELMKATTAVASGAPASNALGGGVYGLTFPESVDVQISARFNKAAGTWSPVVHKLTGRYSLQTRLLPGQTEITGPGGNTTDAVYCDQVTNLTSLGNTAGNPWYVIEAVRRHEAVHEKRFAPALNDAEPTVTADVEAVTIADAPGMTAASAVTALKGDAAFQAEVTKAQQTWLAAILVRVAGDHAAGGPCDVAEKTVTEPLKARICAHAKKKGWPPCADCP